MCRITSGHRYAWNSQSLTIPILENEVKVSDPVILTWHFAEVGEWLSCGGIEGLPYFAAVRAIATPAADDEKVLLSHTAWL